MKIDMKRIRLTESRLRRIVEESVISVLCEETDSHQGEEAAYLIKKELPQYLSVWNALITYANQNGIDIYYNNYFSNVRKIELAYDYSTLYASHTPRDEMRSQLFSEIKNIIDRYDNSKQLRVTSSGLSVIIKVFV